MAAQELLFAIAFPIIPLWLACASACENVYVVSFSAVTKAILSFMIAWLILLPVCELPWAAVRPVPRPLFPFVRASDPKHSVPPVGELSQDKLIYGFRGDRSQVTTSAPAVIFSFGPICLRHAEIVAVVPIFHPVFLAGFNALFFVTADFKV